MTVKELNKVLEDIIKQGCGDKVIAIETEDAWYAENTYIELTVGKYFVIRV